ncbi:MAG: AgmX/PglI C-terminal domain-containing protein [Leptospirales bacterium]|nr:AgmX/PglI C-terminal domain-containing protein [Leptospirales bacterium]
MKLKTISTLLFLLLFHTTLQASPEGPEAELRIQGKMDPDIIRRIVRAHSNEVSACYTQGLTRDPNLRGRLVVQFAITGTGTVAKSVVQSTTLKDRSVANCVATAVLRWKFPKPRDGGSVMVSYPFMLTSD